MGVFTSHGLEFANHREPLHWNTRVQNYATQFTVCSQPVRSRSMWRDGGLRA